MISGINLNATVDYVLNLDKDNPTVWKLGCLKSSELASIGADAKNMQEQMFKLVRLGLKGWKNFDVEFEADENGVLPDIMDRIPLNAIVELGTELLHVNKLSDDEAKN